MKSYRQRWFWFAAVVTLLLAAGLRVAHHWALAKNPSLTTDFRICLAWLNNCDVNWQAIGAVLTVVAAAVAACAAYFSWHATTQATKRQHNEFLHQEFKEAKRYANAMNNCLLELSEVHLILMRAIWISRPSKPFDSKHTAAINLDPNRDLLRLPDCNNLEIRQVQAAATRESVRLATYGSRAIELAISNMKTIASNKQAIDRATQDQITRAFSGALVSMAKHVRDARTHTLHQHNAFVEVAKQARASLLS